jgi:hypothetical protein
LWGLTVLGIIYTIFFLESGGFQLTLEWAVLWLLGGRTFFESIPSNILTMILIGASLYLIGVIFIYGRNIGTTTLSGIFCTRSCCLSLRRYWRSRLSDYKMNWIYNQTVEVRVAMGRLTLKKKN